MIKNILRAKAMAKNCSRFRLSMLSVAVLAANSAYAQTDTDNDNIAEEVVVVGIKRSLQLSVDDKRNAGKIIDSINAEDIGKSTDQNIAEALNRVSGVSINTEDGEGTTVSVRGANSNQTVVTLNGVALGSTEFSQGVDLSAYSADILSKIEVIKTPSADDDEGSLGGLVRLTTRKPLELEENVRTFSVEGRQNDLAEKTDHKFSGTFSQKFADEKFGVIFTFTDESSSVRRDQFSANGYRAVGTHAYTDAKTGESFTTQAAIDAETEASARVGRVSQFEGVTAKEPFANPLAWQQPQNAHPAYQSIARGLIPSNSGYQLHQNERSRQGLDLGLQWEVTEKTDLNFSAIANRQKFDNRFDGAVANHSHAYAGHIDGLLQPNLGFLGTFPDFLDRTSNYDDAPAAFGGTIAEDGTSLGADYNDQFAWTDPQHQWNVLDPDTRTFTRWQARHDGGSILAGVNNFEEENQLFSLELNHEFTDALNMKAGVSTQESESKPGTNIFMGASRDRIIGRWNLHHAPANILVPAGYDCTDGPCRLIGGTTEGSLGSVVDLLPNNDDLWDNVGATGFNPDDLRTHTLQFITSTVNVVTDRNTAAFADFDLDLDLGPITSIEFGAKLTQREKYVDAQTGTPRPSDERVLSESPLTGDVIALDPTAINLIPAAVFDDGEVKPDGFLADLGYGSDNITDGWRRFDPEAALAEITQGDRSFTVDRTQTRGANIDTSAFYLKTNFSFLDDRISGDIGARYVETDVETTGFAGANFANGADGGRTINPILLKRLRDTDQSIRCPVLPETPNPVDFGENSIFYNTNNTDPAPDPTNPASYNLALFEDRNRLARVDGLGYDNNLTQQVFSDDTPIPATNGGLCYDPILEEDGGLIFTMFERNLRRYADVSTDLSYSYDNRQVNTSEGGVEFLTTEDRSRASVASSDTHSYSNVLPSLNVNFVITDDVIARFAASKTMARPAIDDLRAGFGMNEGNIFQAGVNRRLSSSVNLYGAGLAPLESTNLDLSLEWYFAEAGLASVNFFSKDYKNLVETQDSFWYIGDLTRIAADPGNASFGGGAFTLADGSQVPLLHAAEGEAPEINECMARRIQGESNLAGTPELIFGDDPENLCNVFTVTQRVNTASASIRGVELQYSQNYDFLPGFWGGLGTQMNYTFQKAESDETGEVIPGAPRTSYNATVFWQEGGHQVRLAWSGSSDVLEQTSFAGGSRWREGRETLDFSAAYEVTDNLSVTFNAANLTNEPVRTYFTSRSIQLPNENGDLEPFDEGSAINDSATKSRTLDEFVTGTTYRLGFRYEF